MMSADTVGALLITGSLILAVIAVPLQSQATSMAVSSISSVYWISPYMRNLQGEEVSETTVGSPVVSHLDVRNMWDEDRSDVIIFEVRDVDVGITYYLAWQTLSVDADGSYTATASWLPSEPGEYIVRSFALSAITGPDIGSLTMVHESPSIIVASPGTEPPAPSEDETKTFLIGYKLAITPEDAHMVSIDDFPWLRDMIENGEALVSASDKN